MEVKFKGAEVWAALRDHVDLGEEAIQLLKELDRERDRRSLKAWKPYCEELLYEKVKSLLSRIP